MKFFKLLLVIGLSLSFWQTNYAQTPLRSDVFMQGFYWNSPPGGVWYDSLSALAPRLSSAGFGAIWVPSPVKGAGGSLSMGYDPYDHYDFGDYNQKGTVETRFGSKAELLGMLNSMHNVGVQVFADAVLNHMQGGERLAPYQCKPSGSSVPDSAYLIFNYPYGSGRFKKDSSMFYPNSAHCDVQPPYHGPSDPIYKFGEWLDKEKINVRDSLVAWGQYLKSGLGFDGFRIDAVKSIDPNFVGYWAKNSAGTSYTVAEYWGSISEIKYWNSVALATGSNVAMFDFPLRYNLQDMCNNTGGTFDMRTLDGSGLINNGMSGYNVSTFVENHDFDRIGYDGKIDNGHNPVISNKDMAYAYILFSEGRPCVFFKDYFDYGFKGKIDTLIFIRTKFLGGGTTLRTGLESWGIRQDNNSDQNVVGPDFYVARRDGYQAQKGGYLLINDNATQWIDVWVNTNEAIGTKFKDFTGRDADKVVSGPSRTGGPNRVKLWAPPRSYTVYVADTTLLNNSPVIMHVQDVVGYTNTNIFVTVNAKDANDTLLTYSLTNNPAWLTVSAKGLLSGKPALTDTGSTKVILKVTDPKSAFAIDTFLVKIIRNTPPKLMTVNDTVATATKRFELQLKATDAESDSLTYGFLVSPSWLAINTKLGLISATPAVKDTGAYTIKTFASDGKGGFDSISFKLTVKKAQDSVIKTFGKPVIDGLVNIGTGDWLAQWQVTADSDTDSKWHPWLPVPKMDNEITGLFATWDADSLYLGSRYVLNDSNNTMMIYIDAGISGGVTNFNSLQGYNGDYPKNMRFLPQNGIDYFVADYLHLTPSFFKIVGNASTDLTKKINGKRGTLGNDLEIAIAWNEIYALGPGKVAPNAKISLVGILAGGYNYGGGDSSPDNPTVNGTVGPDSLVNLVTIVPDANGDGLPDPTIILGIEQNGNNGEMPSSYNLYQNYPNPFNPSTRISYDLPRESFVSLAVYDILGRQVMSLVNQQQRAGSYSVNFVAKNLSSGVYIYKLKTDGFNMSRKLILMK